MVKYGNMYLPKGSKRKGKDKNMEKLNVKRVVILCFPIVFALSLAVTLAACMAQAGRTLDSGAIGSTEDTSAQGESTPTNQGSVYSSGLTYEMGSDGGAVVKGVGICTDPHVRIPEKTPDGVRITAIGNSAFLGCEALKSITLPTGIREIGMYAFYGSSLESISVGADVKAIGECCFVNCKRLKAISVDSANTEYCSLDGVLFSKDKTDLICYPAGKTDSELSMRLGVKNVLSAAFYGCSFLKTVRFNGTEDEWAKINIGANNEALTSAEIKFKKSDIK